MSGVHLHTGSAKHNVCDYRFCPEPSESIDRLLLRNSIVSAGHISGATKSCMTAVVRFPQPGMREQYLELVQPEDYARPDAYSCTSIPAFLIHDGGGTTFAYHCLEPLKRCIYGIRNPHFRTGDVFAGGLPEMGRLYAEWIRRTVMRRDFPGIKNLDGTVDILIGGWSLGGLLSLEVLKELEDDLNVRIVGILMIDSIYPFNSDAPLVVDLADPIDTLGGEKVEEPINAREKNQMLSQRAMVEARRMLRTWKVPLCSNPRGSSRPSVILLRAINYVPTQGSGISIIDAYREERTLGWDRFDEAMFDEVIDVEGHHFNLFDLEKIQTTSEVIEKALNQLARLAHYK